MSRSISEIAFEIERTWKNVGYAARPYLDAMRQMDKITDPYYADSGRSVVNYFLANATHYRGEDARRIKAELRAL